MRISLVRAVIPLLLALATSAGAQQADSLQQRYLLRPLSEFTPSGSWVAPAITLGVPSAFGASLGDVFAVAAFQERTRHFDKPDGAVAVGFGLGNPRSALGLELAVTSFGTVNTCCRGGFSAKLHRMVGRSTGVAVGVENFATWNVNAPAGEENTDAGRSFYGVASTVVRLRDPDEPLSAVTFSAGVGNGRFRSHAAILDDRDTVRPFGSVSLRVLPPAAVILDWTGQDLILGGSIAPFRSFPFFIAPAVADLTDHPRFVLGVGIGFDYSGLF